jgi:hypothetical protein
LMCFITRSAVITLRFASQSFADDTCLIGEIEF